MLKLKLSEAFLLTIMISVKIFLSYFSLSVCDKSKRHSIALHRPGDLFQFPFLSLLILFHCYIQMFFYNLWNFCCLPSEKCVANLYDNGKSNMAAIMSKVY